MKKIIVFAAAMAAAVSVIGSTTPSFAASSSATTGAKAAAKVPAATKYACSKCGMQYSAADAKKYKFIDPMDGGKLVAIKPAVAPKAKAKTVAPAKPMPSSMPGMKM